MNKPNKRQKFTQSTLSFTKRRVVSKDIDDKTCVSICDENSDMNSSIDTPVMQQDMNFNRKSVTNAEPDEDEHLPTDLSAKGEQPRQPIISFPKSGERKFSSYYYNQYQWIEYSIQCDAVFCQPCRLFGLNRIDSTYDVFSKKGCSNWKKLGEKCTKHCSSSSHQVAEETMKQWLVQQKFGRVDQQLDPVFRDTHALSAHNDHLKTVIDIILFCARQEIPLRGDDETIDSLNKGNFLELMDLLSEYDKEIPDRISKLPKNGTMLSPEIQNELLHCSKNTLQDYIIKQVKDSVYYSVIADEVKDVSKNELLGISLRYIYQGKIYERGIAIVRLESLTASYISEKLMTVLQQLQLSPLDCVGQGYDGASVMSGTSGGVQALVKAGGYHNAHYVHCASHRLNLVLSSVAEVDPTVTSFFDIMDQVHNFMTGVKRHERFIHFQRLFYPDSQLIELTHSCDTRWSSRSLEVEKFSRRFDVIMDTLASFENDSDTDTRLQAGSLLNGIQNQKFVILMSFFNRLYHFTDTATKGLQSRKTNVSSCLLLIRLVEENLSDFDIKEIIEYSTSLCTKYQITDIDTQPSKRAKQLSSKLKSCYVTISVGQNAHDTIEKIEILLKQIIAHLTAELKSRFGDCQSTTMKATASLLPGSDDYMNYELLNEAARMFHFSLPEGETKVFESFLLQKLKSSDDEFSSGVTLIDIFDYIDREIFPNLHRLVHILLTIPQTSCNVERLFSSVKRIKTRLRSRMSTERLCDLCLLAFEKDISKKLDYKDIISLFKRMRNRRLL